MPTLNNPALLRMATKSYPGIPKTSNAPNLAATGFYASRGIALMGMLLWLTAGCSSIRTERDFLSPQISNPFKPSTWMLYPINRVMDVLDVASAGVMLGPGLNVRMQITEMFGICQPMNSCGVEVGLNTHYVDPIRNKDHAYLWKRYRPAAVGCHGGSSLPIPIFKFNAGELNSSPDEINVGAHVLVAGAKAGVRPVEIADLVTGFVLIDLNKDDWTWKSKKKAKAEDEDEDDE